MARFIYIDGVDDAYTVRFPEGYEVTSAAETGAVNTGRVEIDDPAGTLDIVPLKGAYILETAAPSGNQRIWTGYLFNLTIDRGPYRTGPGRVWRADCVDVNFDLSRRFFISASAFRPAETDVARIDWILNGNLATVDLVFQGSLTNLTDNVKNLDADDLRYVTPMEALANIAPQCGKRAFAFYNESTAKVELFYDLADAAVNTSSSKISNDLADAGTDVYPPFIDASLSRLGEEIASTWILNYVGGHERQDRTDTLATYGEHWFTSESSRIGRATTAASWVATTLEVHSVPQDTLTCTLLLPKANVNDIKEGQRLQVKFTHLPDLGSYVYRRVISRIVKVHESGNYLVQLILDNATGTALGGGGPGGFPHPTSCNPGTGDFIQAATATGFTNNLTVALSSAPTAGSTQVMAVALRSETTTDDPTGWTAIPEASVNPFENSGITYYKTTAAGDTGSSTWVPDGGSGDAAAVIAEFTGTLEYDTSAELVSADPYVSGPNFNGATVTPTAGAVAVIVGMAEYKSDHAAPTAGSGWTMAGTVLGGGVTRIAMVYKVVASTTGSYTPAFVSPVSQVVFDDHSYGAQTVAFICTGNDEPPLPGQWVYGEVVTTTAGAGTTAFPYATGSLIVRVDGVLISRASYTETDNATGAFTLSWTPDVSEIVTVDYQGI